MPRGKRASPAANRAGVGHNSGYPDIADVRIALAIETIFEEREKKLREEKKLARKKIEGMKVRLDDTNFLKGLRDKSGSEVVEEFKRQWHLVGAVHEEQAEQLDIFAPKPSAPERRAAHYAMGMIAAIQGKELVIPPGTATDDINRMTAGFNEGKASREKANLMILGKAVENAKAGKVTDGKTGEAVNDKAAADFAKDQAAAGGDDPLVVAGERYPTVRQANSARRRLQDQSGGAAESAAAEVRFWDAYPEDVAEWSDEQHRQFKLWFDALPEGDEQIVINHAGAAAQFVTLRDVRLGGTAATPPDDAVAGEQAGGFLNDPAPVVGDEAPTPTPAPAAKKTVLRPDFNSWTEDWTSWTGLQTMEFKRWFESLPADHPAPSHEGAAVFFKLLREEQENVALAGADDEDGAQAPTPEPEPDMSPEAIDAKAKALAATDFVKPKAVRKKRSV